jgi:two-component system nitrogen regulation response regulator NtrX
MDKDTILIVDAKSEAEVICSILEEEGYKVISVETGKEALDILNRETIGLVILALWLDDEDGIEVFEQIKEQRAELPVILVSGHINVEMAVTALKKGAVDVLEKPLSIDRLLMAVEAILKIVE